MTTALEVAGAVLLCAASGTVAYFCSRPDDEGPSERLEQRLGSVVARLEGLERTNEEQAKSLKSFEERWSMEAVRRNQRMEESLAAREAESKQATAVPAEGPAAPTTNANAPAPEVAAFDLDAALKRLQSDDLKESEWTEVWEQIKKAGKLDEAVALFEARVQATPFDPDAHVMLAQAYLNKIFEAGAGPAAGKWAMKVDGTLDRALELDPKNWDARFMKAVSLSHWPAAFGKQGQAIQQFEMLLEQQKGAELNPRQAQTYLFLGNLYQDIGQGDKARATWQAGADLFPNNEGLRGQLQVNSRR